MFSDMQEHSKKAGVPFIFLADELYLCAKPLPPHEHYGMYKQLENGVGLGRMFLNEIEEWKGQTFPSLNRRLEVSLVTGRSGSGFLKIFQEELEKIDGLKTHLHVLSNIFWGKNVTVAGLLTGSDLFIGLKGKNLGEIVFIPSVMLKEGTELFLDNVSLSFLSNKLKTQIVPISSLSEIRKIIAQKETLATG